MAMGTSIADMLRAQHQIVKLKGGYVISKEGSLSASCPLPIGGILSDKSIYEVGNQLKEVRQAMVDLGYKNTNEIMSFSTLSLPVSPKLKTN